MKLQGTADTVGAVKLLSKLLHRLESKSRISNQKFSKDKSIYKEDVTWIDGAIAWKKKSGLHNEIPLQWSWI